MQRTEYMQHLLYMRKHLNNSCDILFCDMVVDGVVSPLVAASADVMVPHIAAATSVAHCVAMVGRRTEVGDREAGDGSNCCTSVAVLHVHFRHFISPALVRLPVR